MNQERQERFLDIFDTARLGLAIASVVMVVLILFVLKLWIDLNGIVEARAQEARIANEQQVAGCFAAAAQAPPLRQVLVAVEREFNEDAVVALREFIRLNLVNSPTIRDCRQLADDLGVSQ